ncbi:GNAT family N-acetyltransferase [Nonomuraea soli]|uniref:GNAT superfamily N-acetyltransferase n=1 Tax=Nonomuraea soli TaxID=1032476 RepID=A0A7W0CNP3_9ACTN|nr:GNAT family N-acetyltransferase [Nonomuraea soli]MBA2894404.1 GNAT superfamily N-acetyltransferase [Nonomuraea soli]
MQIRPRTPEDLPACVEALAGVQAADRYPVDWPADPGAWLTPEGIAGAWIAVDAGAVTGHVILTRTREVSRLFVTPAARGHGLAGALLETVRDASPGPLTLRVSSEGAAALRFYERSGWRRVATTRERWLNAAGEPATLHHYVSPA